MKRIIDALVTVGTLAVIGLAIVWLIPQVRMSWDGSTRTQGRQVPYQPGEQAPAIGGVQYAAAPATMLLFVRSTCQFCTQGMPFYKSLADSREHNSGAFQIVVASIDSEAETSEYLTRHEVSADKVVSYKPRETRVTGTPTLLVIDRKGVVVQGWPGLQPIEGEHRIQDALRSTKAHSD